MSDVLTGNPTDITTPLTATVASISGSNPMTINTTAAHLFGNGDYVWISGATGNTSPNSAAGGAPWVITVTGTTSFTITAVNGGGTYNANSATATDYSLTPQILVPTDGDTFSAQLSGLTSAYEGLLSRTQYLQSKMGTGTYRLVNFFTGVNNTNPAFTATTYVAGNAVALQTIPTLKGDLLDVTLTGFLQPVSGSSTLHVVTGYVQAAYSENGGTNTQFGSEGLVSWVDNASTHASIGAQITCVGTHTVAASGLTNWVLAINSKISIGDSETVVASIGWLVRQWRPN